jgi:phosphoribosylamine-glycine ligase
VIEEFLEGDELSILTFSDGNNIKSFPPAQDHKRIFDGDKGPNTGGMGCYAPTRIAPKGVLKVIDEKILQPTIDGLRKEGNKILVAFIQTLNNSYRDTIQRNLVYRLDDDQNWA